MYFTLLTNYGQSKLATAIANGTTVQLTQLAVGDGNGAATTPITAQTSLIHENYRVSLNSLTYDNVNNYVIAEGVIPSAVGGFTIREAGIYDSTGNLFAVGNFPDTIKPIISDGSVRDLTIRFIIQVSNTAAVTLLIDPSIVLASQSWVNAKGFLEKSGGTMTGAIVWTGTPTLGTHLTNKDYVDSKTGVDSVPIGSIIWFPATTPPSSFLECDGSAVSRTTYATLFARIGTTFGSGDGSTTFNLPDMRGRFPRGWDHGQGRDISVFTGNQTNGSPTITALSSTATMYVGQPVSGTNIPNGTTIAAIVSSTSITLSANASATLTGNSLTFTGRAFGSSQEDDTQQHRHALNNVTVAAGTGAVAAGQTATPAAALTSYFGGNETRPKNVALLPCIKALLLTNIDATLLNQAAQLYILKAGDTMTGPLTLPGNATSNLHAVPKQQLDAAIASLNIQTPLGYVPVNKAGDTMTGPLTLSGLPSAALHAASKSYVDGAVSAIDLSTRVAKSGDTMTGPLSLSGNASSALHAVPKQQLDAAISALNFQAPLGFTPVNKAGDTMTGLLTLSGNASSALHAVPKQQLDAATALLLSLSGGTMTGALTLSGAPTANLHAATKAYADGLVANAQTKAWVNFNGTGTVAIRQSFNVSSITDNGVGDYTVNFSSAMVDADYCINGSMYSGSTWGGIAIKYATTLTAGSFSVRTASSSLGAPDSSVAYDPLYVCLSVVR